jgi:hypothetical protein
VLVAMLRALGQRKTVRNRLVEQEGSAGLPTDS